MCTGVAIADKKGCGLSDLSLAEMQQVEKKIKKDIFDVLSVESSVKSRSTFESL